MTIDWSGGPAHGLRRTCELGRAPAVIFTPTEAPRGGVIMHRYVLRRRAEGAVYVWAGEPKRLPMFNHCPVCSE